MFSGERNGPSPFNKMMSGKQLSVMFHPYVFIYIPPARNERDEKVRVIPDSFPSHMIISSIDIK